MTQPHSHYFKDVSHLGAIDVYRVADLFGVTHPALQHALKKVLATGTRGIKDARQDAQEAIDSLNRYLAMVKEDAKFNEITLPSNPKAGDEVSVKGRAIVFPSNDLSGVNAKPSNPADLEDRHADLRKTWAPGQKWQNKWPYSDAWADLEGTPRFDQDMDYRRHPDDKDPASVAAFFINKHTEISE